MNIYNENRMYIVAGDEMEKLMNEKYSSRNVIPFREDFSKGEYNGFDFDSKFIANRSSFWNVSENEYIQKMSPIINLDLSKDYILCFGDDDCCKANLSFMIGVLKSRGYLKPIKVLIVDEYNLTVLRDYIIN